MDIKPCPKCGNIKISFNIQIITKYEYGDDKIKVNAVCRNCNYRSLSAFGRYSEDEGKKEALKMWNDIR